MPSMTEKIIQNHLREGVIIRGEPIAIRIDQTLTQDATGTMGLSAAGGDGRGSGEDRPERELCRPQYAAERI